MPVSLRAGAVPRCSWVAALASGPPAREDAAVELPEVVVFDVNETLSDLRPLGDRFAQVGAPAGLGATWFASVLRDGFALTAAGGTAPFAEIGRALLLSLFHDEPGVDDPEGAADHVLAGFGELAVHPDVVPGVRALADAGLRLVTLSNGAAEVAERLLAPAGVRDLFEHVLSVQPSGAWKPSPVAYAEVTKATGVPLERMLLVAVHAWDVDGAHRAGMRTAWVDRQGAPYPPHFSPAGLTVAGIDDLASRLAAGG